MYPFYISDVDENTQEDEVFRIEGNNYSVKISTFCKGLNKGHHVEDVISEAIYFWLRKDVNQSLTTSNK